MPAPASAQTDTPAISFTVATSADRTDGPFTLGTKIRIGSTPVTVTALGAQDGGRWLAGSIQVGIWSGDGSQLLRSATVASTTPVEAGGYRYASITALTLSANTEYLIGGLAGGSYAKFVDEEGVFTSVNPNITLLNSTYNTGSTLTAPTTPGSGGVNKIRWSFANIKTSATGSLIAGPIFSANLDGFTGSPTSIQDQSGRPIASGANLSGWVKQGTEAIRLVNYGTTVANWAAMIYGDETITMASGVDANTDGATYTVSFDVGPAIFDNPDQGTGVDDQLAVRVIDEGNDWVEQSTVSPGAWSGTQNFFRYSFNYTGRGTGNVRLQVAAADPIATRFAGAIDNITITAVPAADADNDGLSDSLEGTLGTDPNTADPAATTVGSPFNFTVGLGLGTFNFTATGLPAGLSINALTGQITGTPTAVTPVAGTVVAVSAETAAAGPQNRNILIRIAKGNPTLSGITATSIPFGQTLSTSVVTGTAKNVSGVEINGTWEYQNSSSVPPVGTRSYDVVFRPDNTDNYNSANGTVSLTVTPALLPTVTFLPPSSLVYDGTGKIHTATASGVSGFSYEYRGRNSTIYAATDEAPVNAGDYTVKATSTDPNYTGFAEQDFTITKAAATVTLGSLSQIYNGSPKPVTVTIDPVGVLFSVQYNGGSTIPRNAGTYPVLVTVTDPNYSGSKSGTLAIAKADPVIAAPPSASAITYGQALNDSALIGGTSTPSGSFAFTGPAIKPNAGTADQGVTFTPGDADNYNTVATTVSVLVNPAPLTITGISIANKPFDGTKAATINGTASYVGLVNGETFAVTGTPTAVFLTPDVGNGKPVEVNGYTAPSANYTVTQPSGLTANITAAAATDTDGDGFSNADEISWGMDPNAKQTAVYDFNSLVAGNLNGQDGWRTSVYGSGGDGQVITWTRNGTKAVQYANSGPDFGVSGTRLNNAAFRFPQQGTGKTTVEIDVEPAWWGMVFGMGFDANADGLLSTATIGNFSTSNTEMAWWVKFAGSANGWQFYSKGTAATTTGNGGTGNSLAYARVRVVLDYAANGGSGSASVFVRDLAVADSPFLPVSGLQDLSLGLNPGASGVTNPRNWNGLGFHIEGATGVLDNLSISNDTDGDGLADLVETRTGTYVSATNTGTDPTKADTDGDGLSDRVETKTGTYVSASNTGTDPLVADTDGDGLNDNVETDTRTFVARPGGNQLPVTFTIVTNKITDASDGGTLTSTNGGSMSGKIMNGTNEAGEWFLSDFRYTRKAIGGTRTLTGAVFATNTAGNPYPRGGVGMDINTGGNEPDGVVKFSYQVRVSMKPGYRAGQIFFLGRNPTTSRNYGPAGSATGNGGSIQVSGFSGTNTGVVGDPNDNLVATEGNTFSSGADLLGYQGAEKSSAQTTWYLRVPATEPVSFSLDLTGQNSASSESTAFSVQVFREDTGTSPLVADTDGDTLLDGVETGTGAYVSATNTGTDPTQGDTDGDKVPDGVEVTNGTNPLDPASNPLPVITTQLVGGTKKIGEPWTFTVVATDPTATFLAYQWKKNGVNLGGGTFDNFLTISSLQASDAGDYEVVVSNPLGNVTSSSVSLTVLEPRTEIRLAGLSTGYIVSARRSNAGELDWSSTTGSMAVGSQRSANGSADAGNQRAGAGFATFRLTSHFLTALSKPGAKFYVELKVDGIGAGTGGVPYTDGLDLRYYGVRDNALLPIDYYNAAGTGGDQSDIVATTASTGVKKVELTQASAISQIPTGAVGQHVGFGFLNSAGVNTSVPVGNSFAETYSFNVSAVPSDFALVVSLPDNDEDGLADAFETNTGTYVSATDAGSDPTKADTDGDGVNDGAEVNTFGSNPVRGDTDGDGLNDGVETKSGTYVSAANTGTDPAKADTDEDGLNDGVETATGTFVSAGNTGTNPNQADSDDDGVNDGAEIAAGTSPLAKPSFAAGTFAVTFDGISTQRVISPRPVQDDFTFSFWMKTTATGTGSTHWFEGRGLLDGEVAGVTDDFGTSLMAGGKVGFGVGNPDITLISAKSVNDNAWRHIAVTREASTGAMRIYIDGVLDRSGSGPTGTKSAPGRLTLGSSQTNLNYFQGEMADFRVYDRVISAADVWLLANRLSVSGSAAVATLLIDVDADGLDDAIDPDPTNKDTDGDGLEDGPEVNIHGSDPQLADTDGDGAGDKLEVDLGNSPTVASAYNRLINGSFEDGTVKPGPGEFLPVHQDNVPGWKTTANNEFKIELWYSGFLGSSGNDGNILAELNYIDSGTLYQDVVMTVDSAVSYSFLHRARGGTESIEFRIDRLVGGPGSAVEANFFTRTVSTGTSWVRYTGTPAGTVQAGKTYRFSYISVIPAGGGAGNLLDAASFETDQDNDGLGDSVETETGTYVSLNDTGTGPLDSDSDNDGIPDGTEAFTYGTNPTKADSDGDGAEDAAELAAGTDPLKASDRPVLLSAGWNHTLYLPSPGQHVLAWGLNEDGRCGLGHTISPVVNGEKGRYRDLEGGTNVLSNLVAVSAGGSHSLVLRSVGGVNRIWAAGANSVGQLGQPTATLSSSALFREVPGGVPSQPVAIAAGSRHSLTLGSDGRVYAWGDNSQGQLGLGTTAALRDTPAPVPGLINVKAIAVGADHSVALTTDGRVYAWGRGNSGQLGYYTLTGTNAPRLITGIPTAVQIAAGDKHTLIRTEAGEVYACGANTLGQAGLPAANNLVRTPTKLSFPGGAATVIRKLVAGLNRAHAIATNGKVYAWGYNYYGELGLGYATTTPPYGIFGPTEVPALFGAKEIASGGFQTFALDESGTLAGTGLNNGGQLGTGGTNNVTSDPAVATESGKLPQEISFPLPGTSFFTDTSIPLTVTVDSGLVPNLTTSDPTVVSIDAGRALFVKAGTARITATQPGNNTFNAAQPVFFDITVTDPPPLTLQFSGNTDSFLVPAAGTNTVPVDAGLQILGRAATTLTAATVKIVSGRQTGDTLALAGYTGPLTATYNAGSGTLRLSGATNLAGYQEALRKVVLTTTNRTVANRTITMALGSGIAFTNGHVYEFVSSAADWPTARGAAKNRRINGQNGYLANVTSAQENSFLLELLQEAGANGWLGGADITDANFRWMDGPEAGARFWNGNSGGSPFGSAYANWGVGEPNDYAWPTPTFSNWFAKSYESYVMMVRGSSFVIGGFSRSTAPGKWNDAPLKTSTKDQYQLGYLVEYGPGEPLLFAKTKTFQAMALTWRANGAGVAVTGYTGSGGEVIIPATLDGLTVNRIDPEAFKGKSTITQITIPAGVTSIGYYAFANCTSLEAIFFEGDAPTLEFGSGDPFAFVPAEAVVYYRSTRLGWGSSFGGRATAPYTSPGSSPGRWDFLSGNYVHDPADGMLILELGGLEGTTLYDQIFVREGTATLDGIVNLMFYNTYSGPLSGSWHTFDLIWAKHGIVFGDDYQIRFGEPGYLVETAIVEKDGGQLWQATVRQTASPAELAQAATLAQPSLGMGTSPGAGGMVEMMYTYTRVAGGSVLAGRYVAGGLQYEVQISTDLTTWNPVTVEEVDSVPAAEGYENATVRVVTGFSRAFLRLKITN